MRTTGDPLAGGREASSRASSPITVGDVEPRAAYGQPAEELAPYSASLDLLIVGSRGYGPIGRLIHGSTSQQLAHSARCPLLVLTRRPAIKTDEASEHARDSKGATDGGTVATHRPCDSPDESGTYVQRSA